jgi:hypothetical protein
MLHELLRGGDGQFLERPHAQVHLWKDPSAVESIFVDFELHSYDVPQWTFAEYDGPEIMRTANWLDSTDGPFTRSRVAHLICGRVLSPLADVLCYFASDLGGTKGVAALLAMHMREPPASDTPAGCLPRVVVVVETAAKKFDSAAAERALINSISHQSGVDPETDVASRLLLFFSQIRVVGVPKGMHTREATEAFQTRLQTIRKGAAAARKLQGYLFARDHAFTFSSRLLDHFCSEYDRTFSFLVSSRPHDFSLHDFSAHITELFAVLPSQVWLWHLACPLIASAVIFASYPPSSHGMCSGNLLLSIT